LIRSAIFGKNTRGLKITHKSQNTCSEIQGRVFSEVTEALQAARTQTHRAGRLWNRQKRWNPSLHVRHFSKICIFQNVKIEILKCICVAAACGVSATSTKNTPLDFGNMCFADFVIFPQTVLPLRGSGSLSLEAGEVFAGSARGPQPLIFAAIYSTWCMSHRSLSCKTVFFLLP